MRRLRERRAQAQLAAVPDPRPRDPSGLLLPAVEATLAALKLTDQHAAHAQLARVYAMAIDDAPDPVRALRLLGGPFLRVLAALPPPRRPAVRPAPPSGLSKLRAERVKTLERRRRLAGK